MKLYHKLTTLALASLLVFFPAKSVSQEKAKEIKQKHGAAILMYHSIDYGAGGMNVSPENFRKQLDEIHKLGYKTARLEDIIKSKVSDEKKVVLRFDDSRESQFKYIKDKNGKNIIDPKCAVGIILDFYKQHPDFGKSAIFFVIPHVEFKQPEYSIHKLEFLLQQGMEIGNHGYYHYDWTKAKPEEIDKTYGKAMQRFEKLIGKDAGRIQIIAAPFGVVPRSEETKKEMNIIQWNGKKYRFIGIAYAYGSNNKVCPERNSKEFNQYALPCLEVNNTNFDSVLKKLE